MRSWLVTSLALTACNQVWGLDPVRIDDGGVDGAVVVPPRVVRVAAGGNHTCALTDDGAVRCWGRNQAGQLGVGDSLEPSPTTLARDHRPAGLTLGVAPAQLIAGGAHTCARYDDGALLCWGAAAFGQLGYGSNQAIGDTELPRSQGVISVGQPVGRLSAGETHTCAIDAMRRVFCWGSAANGRLGYGNLNNVGDDANETPASAGPVPTAADAAMIATGRSHTCLATTADTVRCWGLAASGQLGYGNTVTTGDGSAPIATIAVPMNGTVTHLTAGADHTCAARADHSVLCWGSNSQYQLGFASSNLGDGETLEGLLGIPLGVRVTALAAGGNHTCALLEGGAVRCWGDNAFGQLGVGDTLTVRDAVQVPAVDLGGPATAIAVGTDHTCAIREDQQLFCWGAGAFGKLGYGNTDDVGATPATVPLAVGPVPL